ncbi:hypothetical protein E1K98_12460 [Salmonella enterica subsp. enterica serovar Fluntern]|nr:hypothetical protein [Salmonella enterica]EBQ6246228.1 hypothetical protein [Salmonella enterica subsp. enterica serovar Fluntern]ECI4436410.1 hypothetical protein [Salmonella enterica subsp. enterica]EAR7208631.1 hypothetical protein [Salmonella enterica]EAS0141686.1 hypothetical protein [Salmonella enterica]
MFSASITLLNGSPFHSPVTRKCIYHLHKKPAVASSDKRNPRECEDCYCCGGAGSGIQWVTPIISIPSQ